MTATALGLGCCGIGAFYDQEAADLLSVSRPYLVSLLESGKISFHKAGSHRRIVLKDLLAFKKQQELESDAVMANLPAKLRNSDWGMTLEPLRSRV